MKSDEEDVEVNYLAGKDIIKHISNKRQRWQNHCSLHKNVHLFIIYIAVDNIILHENFPGMVMLCQECCHIQNKEKEKKLIDYKKLAKLQDDNTEEKLINLAVMGNTLEKKHLGQVM